MVGGVTAPARAWDDLVATATLGTERRPVGTDDLPPTLAQHADGLGTGGPERLLETAALAVTQRRAGLVPAPAAGPDPAAAPSPVRPAVPPAAAGRLRDLLAGDDPDLVATWLEVAAAAGLRVPEHLLPALLDHAAAAPGRGQLVAPVLDLPGAWLAAFRPRWTAAVADGAGDLVEPPDEDWWTHGTTRQRTAWLRHRHRSEPDVARAALGATWTSEPADVRVALLEALRPGLGDDDEAVVAPALTDRSRLVRELAAALLARLPGSAYVRTWRAHLEALGVAASLHAGVVPTPPAAPPGAPAPAPPAREHGDRLTAVVQGLAQVPAHAWDAVADPDGLVRLAGGVADGAGLLRAWAWSAARDRHVALARALVAAGVLTPQLLVHVPVGERVDLVVRALAADPRSATGLAHVCPAPWPPELSTAVLQAVAALPAAQGGAYQRTDLVRLLGRSADVGDPRWPEALRRLTLDGPAVVQRSAAHALRDLALRTEIHQEIHRPARAAGDTDRPVPGEAHP